MSLSRSLLEVGEPTWHALLSDLKERGKGRRESGAFLLGEIAGDVRKATAFIPYEVLDSRAQHYAYVRIGSEAFGVLWEECAKRKLQVVADVHTHPMGPRQSWSDRENPMVSMAGHVALIVPGFAMGCVTPKDVSFNIYHGQGRWKTYLGVDAAKRLVIKGG